MKKQLLLLAFMFLSLAVNAQDAVEIDGIYYKLDINTKTAEVTRHLHHTYSGDVVIPSKVTKDEVDYSVTSIGKEAFYLSTELVSVTISDHVTNIADHAFDACWSLASVNIPNSVTHIGEYAFASCSNLEVYCYAEQVPETGIYVFDFPNTLHVPAASINAYRNDEEWSKFWHIVALKDDDPKPTGIKNINQNTIIGQHYYSLDGKRINQPQRGLNIIKMNDGTTRKVVVK